MCSGTFFLSSGARQSAKGDQNNDDQEHLQRRNLTTDRRVRCRPGNPGGGLDREHQGSWRRILCGSARHVRCAADRDA